MTFVFSPVEPMLSPLFSTLPDVPLKSQLFQSMNVPAGVGIDTGSPEAAVAESPPIAIMADRVRAELNFLNMNDG